MTINRNNTNLPLAIVTVATTTALAVGMDSRLRQGETILDNPTPAKVQRTGLYILGSIIPWVTASCSNNDGGAVLFSLLGSAACIFGASRIRDYDDARELTIMRTNARHMSFRELVERHGLKSLVEHGIVENLPVKFVTEHQGFTFSKIISNYSLKKIANFGLCPLTPNGFLHDKFVTEAQSRKFEFIREWESRNDLYTNIMSPEMYRELILIQNQTGEIDRILNRTLTELNTRFPDRTEIQQRKFAEREQKIPEQARQFGRDVTSKASGNAVDNAVNNALWDGNGRHVVRDASTGLNVAEVAGRHAEQAQAQQLRTELQRDRADQRKIAQGAQQQQRYNTEVADAHQIRLASIASLENRLNNALAL